MKRTLSTLALLALTALHGCSNEASEDTKPTSLNDVNSTAKVQEEAQKKQVANAPAADKSVPLESYVEMSSGKQAMFAYLAVDSMPLNYEKVAGQLSQDYRSQSDEFKKRDMLAAMKPAIDAEVAKAKKGGYYYMSIDDRLENYNFDNKAFPHTGFSEGGYRYFYDMSDYKLKFSNSAQYRSIKVADENLAREIEALRSKGSNLETVIYFYVNATELGSDYAIAEITKVKIKEKSGKTLVEI